MKTLQPGIKCMEHEIKICNDQKNRWVDWEVIDRDALTY